VLGLPIPEITLERAAASAVILAADENKAQPVYYGLEQATSIKHADLKIFGKPNTRKYRRMGIALAYDNVDADIELLRSKAKYIASLISVK
jgi:phosphoribosylglycinamide formyltransferase 2